jgi:hypothetical protein
LARLDEKGDDFPASALAIGLRLPALVGDGEIIVGLPAGRDSYIEGGAKGSGHDLLQNSMATRK